MTKTLLFASPEDKPDPWREALAALLPDAEFRAWPEETGDVADIDYALVWKPERGVMRTLPNLKAIFSLGAGVDHLFSDPELPAGVPVVRLVDRCLTQGMSEYVLYWVIHHHRGMGAYRGWQQARTWKRFRQADAERRRVGVLGLGELGGDAARKLAGLHYQVAGWSRRHKDIPGVESFFGEDQFVPFLERTEILVCLLPLTPETENILNAETFAHLPQGACVINCARGGHLVEDDLIAALDSGHLKAATLDVFKTEPLPEDSPLWSHPKIDVTPHMASLTVAHSAAEWIALNIKRIEAGEPPLNTVDPATGY